MMRYYLLILLVLLAIETLSCIRQREPASKLAEKNTQFYKLDGAGAYLTIKIDDNDCYISISDTTRGFRYLHAINGCGNCFINIEDSTYFQKVSLIPGSENEFVVIAAVIGSTYGGEYLFMIWNDGNEWNISRAPFHRFGIRRTINRDEIINYLGATEEVYVFEKGQLIKQ